MFLTRRKISKTSVITCCIAWLIAASVIGCSSQVTDNTQTTEIVEESVKPAYGDTFDTKQTEYYTLHSFGQYSSVAQQGNLVRVYPNYMYNQYVELEPVLLSNNNFWADFVKGKGYTLADCSIYDNGIFVLRTNEGTFGYVRLSPEEGLIANTNTLPHSYVKVVLDNVE